MVKFNGVNHLAMATGDMDTTIRYWRDLLGMRLVAGLGEPGYRHYFFELSPTDLVAFFEWEGVEPIPKKDHGQPVQGPFAFDHVSFGVETLEDLWELRDKIVAAGFWVSAMIDHGFIYSIYSFDPNGIAVEFSWNKEGIDIRKKPMMGDKVPTKEAKAGDKPQSGKWPPMTKRMPPSQRRIYEGVGSELFQGVTKE